MTRTHTSAPQGFRDTLRQLNSAQKSGVGVPAYTRWVNRKVARVFAAAAVKFGITPNGVTALSASVSLAGMALMIVFPPSLGLGLGVALLFALGYALDSADGQVARVTGASSPAGEWLDHVVDSMRTPAMHLTILIGMIKFPAAFPLDSWQIWWLPLAFTVLITGHFMSQILAEQLRNNRGTAAPAAGGNLRSFINLHMDAGTFCWIFIFWGTGWGFILVYGLLFVGNAATVLLSMRRKFITLSTPAGA
ncbi:MAG: CDP-alcohol phosphatidyltransferase family protein [Rothia sp. (in: high G+C Gram-positive bacteria)]|nr:CDP-alcohol phosphatidyltransferase family protein [Rothia sp. (in: high G+C Gram-positive bacteria)]